MHCRGCVFSKCSPTKQLSSEVFFGQKNVLFNATFDQIAISRIIFPLRVTTLNNVSGNCGLFAASLKRIKGSASLESILLSISARYERNLALLRFLNDDYL